MSAGRYDIVLESGATFDLPIRWVDSNASSIDLTGYSAHIQARETPASVVYAEFTSNLTSTGFIFLNGSSENREDGANGNLRVFMTAANTSLLGPFRGVYQLELRSPGGYVTRLLEGQFRVDAEITR